MARIIRAGSVSIPDFDLGPRTPKTTTPAATTPVSNRKPSGIAGTETLTTPEGEEVLVYSGTDRAVIPGTPANRKPSGIAGTEILINDTGEESLVYRGTETVVEPGKPAPVGNIDVGGGGEDGGGEEDTGLDIDQSNALDVVAGYMKMWGLDGLTEVVTGWIKNKVSEDAALMNLRQQPAYKKRFSGLALREKNNLPPIDEATYLALEDDYDAWARYYGVEGAFGTTREQREGNFATLIGKNVNAPAFKEYVDTVVTRVDRADPLIKQTLNRFYGITDTDLKNYYINPSENVKALQEKVTAAEIGAAGIAQALNVTRARAEEFARFGVERAGAITGYERIAGALAEGKRLTGIYREEGIDYTQEMAEEEEFKGLESAARARRRLGALSEASFGGSGAVTQGALGRSVAGQI